MKKTFEDAYNQLQIKVNDLKDETKTLDESIENFKEAIELFKVCEQKLNDAKEQIVEIIEDEENINN